VIALQAEVLGAWVLGIRSLVALTGDKVSLGDLPQAKAVFEVNSIGLLDLIQRLNGGSDLAGGDIKGSLAMVPGVVVNPNAKNIPAEIKRLRAKKEAGGMYALSQPVFDKEAAKEFFSEAAAVGIPILMGLMPLKSKKSAEGICSIPGIKVSETFLSTLEKLEDEGTAIADYSIAHAVEIAEELKDIVNGFHVISGATPVLSLRLASALRAVKESIEAQQLVAGRALAGVGGHR
jgi:5,10-methylenetetrahydrofolate reductase